MSNSKQTITARDVLSETDQKQKEDKYNKYVKNITPTHNLFANMIKAFIVGGIICCLGQAIINLFQFWGYDFETAKLYEVLVLVGLAVILTGFNLYQKIAKWAGAGRVVPITGFANSVAAPAIEFKKEGQVFGIGCKIFTICGPVILYGVFAAWLLGFIYWILKICGVL